MFDHSTIAFARRLAADLERNADRYAFEIVKAVRLHAARDTAASQLDTDTAVAHIAPATRSSAAVQAADVRHAVAGS